MKFVMLTQVVIKNLQFHMMVHINLMLGEVKEQVAMAEMAGIQQVILV